ncbi:unnamed protein product [Anisakis simplex]|uniref:Fes1 domain-containing protein n=1 Tax=Anisakis simplex TaxID=6269 RepID=A0A0M3IZP3_ANISI|nr:unnamed protein product [Anisakis simplex]
MGDPSRIPDAAWKELLVAAQTAAGDSHGPPQKMPEEKRKFIESAMSDLVQKTDPVRQMKKLIDDLRQTEEPKKHEDTERLKAVVDSLEDIVCQVDAAVDFCKLGGLGEILRLMNCKCDEARCEVMRLIPTLAQHNPKVQDIMLDQEVIAALLSLIVSTEESSDVRVKALSGVSSVVRAHEGTYNLLYLKYFLSRFRQLNGFVVLMDAFKFAHHSGDEKVANKTAIVFANLAHDLGYQGALDHGLPSCIIRMYGDLAPSSDAASYLREYIEDNVSLKSIDSENKKIIEKALHEQLEYKKEHNADDPVWNLVIDSLHANCYFYQ